MTFIRSASFDAGGRFASRPALKPMTKRDIVNGVRKRRYSWGKSAQEMADEIGAVSADQVRSILLGKDFSDAIAARVVTWLKRPVSATGLAPNRDRKMAHHSSRAKLMRRMIALIMLGKQYAVAAKSNAKLQALTEDELRAYYWQFDKFVKDAICKRYGFSHHYLLRDSHEAWEWIERLEHLQDFRRSSSGPPAG